MTVQLRDGLARAFQADNRFTVTAANDISVNSLPTVFLQCSGRVIQGRSRGLRSLINVVVFHAEMTEAEPWENVQPHLDWALETIYTVPNAFPELLPIQPAQIASQENAKGSKEELYSASIIQVLSE